MFAVQVVPRLAATDWTANLEGFLSQCDVASVETYPRYIACVLVMMGT
jgi:hypothetical protein